jgi:urea transport system ATP-binding protein
MLEVKNLQVAYGESEIISQLSFSVGRQETLAVMGRNGMG